MQGKGQNHTCDILPPNPQPQSNHEKTSDNKIEGHFQNPGH